MPPRHHAVPYESATSGASAREEITRLLRRMGCERIGFMDEFDRSEVLLAFVHRGRDVHLRASAKGWAAMYTIALFGDVLLACVPSGQDVIQAARAEADKAGLDWEEPTVINGVRLTDSPRDADQVVYSGTRTGWLTDETGRTFNYAVKR